LADLLTQLETYFERYLHDVDERRQRCHEKLTKLLNPYLNRFKETTA